MSEAREEYAQSKRPLNVAVHRAEVRVACMQNLAAAQEQLGVDGLIAALDDYLEPLDRRVTKKKRAVAPSDSDNDSEAE